MPWVSTRVKQARGPAPAKSVHSHHGHLPALRRDVCDLSTSKVYGKVRVWVPNRETVVQTFLLHGGCIETSGVIRSTKHHRSPLSEEGRQG
jgi:hypothetical protein